MSCSGDVGEYRGTNNQAAQNSSAACVCFASMVEHPDTGACVCEPGSFFDSAAQRCRACQRDSFRAGYSAELPCTLCSALLHRTTNELTARTQQTDCVCSTGFVSSLAVDDGLAECLPCEAIAGVAGCASGVQSQNSSAGALLSTEAGFWLTADPQYLLGSAAKATSSGANWFVVVACPYLDACPGGAGPEVCAVGFEGPACGLCAPGFGRLGQGCATCPSKTLSDFLVFLCIVMVIAGCGVIVYLSAAASENVSDSSETLLKIAITHLQILSFTGNFSTQWPETLIKVFAVPASAATVSSASDNIAITCSAHPTLYTRAVLVFFLPLMLAAGVTLGYVAKALVQRTELSRAALLPKIKQGILALLYVAHPGIVQSVLKNMVCYDVGTQSLAKNDMSVSCSDPAFLAVRTLAIGYLAGYGLGGILAILYLLYREHREGTHDLRFMTQGYKRNRYMWDVVITVRQLILVTISLFATAPLQLFFSTWILLFSWMLHHYVKPFVMPVPTSMDNLSHVTLLVTVTVGSLFYNNVIEPESFSGFLTSIYLIFMNFFTILVLVTVTLREGIVIFIRDAMAKKRLRAALISPEARLFSIS
eukprot:TRINITY_DN3911_c1_g1_i6.p1 TRINITY_DN3911_c1_g1~~TRINITY_DN3911_c1_g1_i6.p1  ORF type:complete len:593 (+),score=136.09 TRINITY_DN3911_c1_g1_i6:936-2714(+)